jgi:hypothetical protein
MYVRSKRGARPDDCSSCSNIEHARDDLAGWRSVCFGAVNLLPCSLVDFSRFMLVRATVRAEPRDGFEGRGPRPIAYYADEDPGHVAHVPGGCYSPASGAWHGPSAVVVRMPRADLPVKFVDTSPCDPRAP